MANNIRIYYGQKKEINEKQIEPFQQVAVEYKCTVCDFAVLVMNVTIRSLNFPWLKLKIKSKNVSKPPQCLDNDLQSETVEFMEHCVPP